jgi:hypothetical protein
MFLSLYDITNTIVDHRHRLTVGHSSQTETYVGEFSHLQNRQFHPVSRFNPVRVALTAFLNK